MKDDRAPVLSERLKGRQLTHIGLLNKEELDEVIALGEWFRDNSLDMTYADHLKGRVQALLFVYESTRTRMSFESAMAQLGGHNIYLSVKDTQMGRGENAADTAKAMDQFIDVFVGRLWKQEDIEVFAENLTCPVLNACTPLDHSTHVIGELMSIKKALGKLEGCNLVYTGMARGIMHSLIRVSPVLGINLTVAIPESYKATVNQDIWRESKRLAEEKGTRLEICGDLMEAVRGADFIQASTLIRSMLAGEQSPEEKGVDIPRWTVTNEVLDASGKDVLYSHSGPAHRNICATDEVMDGPRSLIREEARNSIFSKKALLALMLKR